ncbi:MAG: response regulator [Deinococcales bacterium]
MAVPRVLLVEPNDQLRRLFRRRFVREGFELVEAADGEAALGAAHAGRPDLVVVERSVRDASGHDLPGRLASEPILRGVPVIVLGARGSWASPEERGEGSEGAAVSDVLPEVAAWTGTGTRSTQRHELHHPFRPGRLVELARGALDGEAGAGAGDAAG